MTYAELLQVLQNLDPERLSDTVTVYDEEEDEYFGATGCVVTKETDVLDENHLFLTIKGETKTELGLLREGR